MIPITPVARITQHFTAAEMACKCCGYLFVSDGMKRLLNAAEILRAQVGRPVTVISGCRCLKHNREIGGAANSRHLYGDAMDLAVDGFTPEQLAQIVRACCPDVTGIGVGRTKFHMDARLGTVRTEWRYS